MLIPYFVPIHTSVPLLLFFSGDSYSFTGETVRRQAPLGIAVLYGAYRRQGYQTVFQEDLCWYDRWGMMMTGMEMKSVPKERKQKMKG